MLGKTPAQAERRLADEGLDVGSTREEYSGAYERGTVMGTDPAPGERVRGNGSVDLVVSRGPRIVEVPELRGGRWPRRRGCCAGRGWRWA
ncbi:PASTA domain-containing protein [Streptomyces somaliensis]|nr:PASTA domain-containing protein [Streptomyces somaliensis]